MAEQKSEAKTAQINNTILVVMMVAIFGIWAYGMFGSSGKLPVDQQAVADEIEDRLVANAETLEEEAKALAADVVPPLGEAIGEQAWNDYPRYVSSITSQDGKLYDAVEKLLKREVKNQYGDFLDDHQQVLVTALPEYDGTEEFDQTIKEFRTVLERLIERYYLDEFRQQSLKTAELWDQFEPIDPPSNDEPDLEVQLIDYIADWSVLALKEKTTEALE